MLSIQESTQKNEVKEQLRTIRAEMDAYGNFHPDRSSILNVQSSALRLELEEMLNTIPLSEFLAKSGSTGIAGAAYMVPDKLHSDLIKYSAETDLVSQLGVVTTGWEGGDLKVDIVNKKTYKPKEYTSGGAKPTQTVETAQATITPKTFGLPVVASHDLVEDAAYSLIDQHIKAAAQSMGEYSTELALTVLKTGTDGWGTVNTEAASADETLWLDVGNAIASNTDDKSISNTVVCTTEAWEHSISKGIGKETAGGAAGDFWQPDSGYQINPVPLNFIYTNNSALHLATDTTAMTKCVTVVFDKNNALITGRKRWMQIDNYSDPIRDIEGAFISARQDSATLFNDSICVITET